jgi:small subunit ribosomal protein S7
MPRRARAVKREMRPDPKFGSYVLSKFINKVMLNGKKATAERIMYDALQIVEDQMKKDPMDVFEQALKNITPLLQVRARRVGGATYQVPVEVKPERGQIMAIRWLVDFARARTGRSMAEKLAAELINAAQGEGAAVKKRQDTHKMAEANKAFAHYRW